MRSKITWLALLGVLALALIAAGCGGGADKGAGNSGAAPEGGAATEGGAAPEGATAGGDAAQGKAVYDANCAACHGPNGEGGVGPNLKSANGKPAVKDRLSEEEHLNTVKKGRLDKGMPAWESLGEAQIKAVVAYERNMN